MFVLDTNVLSALIGTIPPLAVARWMGRHTSDLMFTATVCQAELLAGLAIMPEGQRRSRLEQEAEKMFGEDFHGRILPFDSDAAVVYAQIFSEGRRIGRPIPAADLMIAATALVHNATVVTRNARHFNGCGVTVINPWDD